MTIRTTTQKDLNGGSNFFPLTFSSVISSDGAKQISRAERDCRKRRFRLLQTSFFAPDGAALSQQKNLDWAEAAPETVSESRSQEGRGSSLKISYAVVIVPQTKMRGEPNADSQVLRIARAENRFPLGPFKPAGAGSGVYDSNPRGRLSAAREPDQNRR